ncbi:MAG: site-specific DNA-methyltransferase [Prevotella sp.]|nr:site-specific DNA-methyltransferase [Prevotella sp.]
MSSTINKADLISKLQTLEGLTNEERSNLIDLLRQHKKYGLVWEDKPEDVEERLRDELPVLKEVKERFISSDAPDAPNHILIEGDNLEALTALSYTHEGKIDVIYIDPPYNTGNKDFVYNDSFVDSEDSYRHSKWLSFMNKRLKIAKRLLSDKGVIFISIDENELAQLRIIGDEVFLQKNFVGQWNWYKSATPPALSKKIKRNIEYILCWQKGENTEKFKGLQKTSSSNDPFTKPQNTFKELLFAANSITCKMDDGIYPIGIYGTDKFPNELLDDLVVEGGKNKFPVRFKNRFIWIQTTLDENIKKGLYIELSKKLVLSYKRSDYAPEVPPNLIDTSLGVDTTENAGRQLIELFDGRVVFDYPKPVSLLKYVLNFPYGKDSTILDFFAGSGTTLHATMQLNAEDGGHRQCILVTNNENNICEEVTYERNKRVINGYTTPKGVKVEGLKANTLRYYKTDYISRDRTQKNMRGLVAAATDLLCIKEDLYEEKKTFGRFKLKPQLARYFNNGKRHMLIVCREELIDEIAEEIKNLDFAGKRLKIYVFSPGRYAFTDNFREVEDKVELVALPAAIYDAYQKVLPKRREKLLEDLEKEEGTKIPTDLFEGQGE